MEKRYTTGEVADLVNRLSKEIHEAIDRILKDVDDNHASSFRALTLAVMYRDTYLEEEQEKIDAHFREDLEQMDAMFHVETVQ